MTETERRSLLFDIMARLARARYVDRDDQGTEWFAVSWDAIERVLIGMSEEPVNNEG